MEVVAPLWAIMPLTYILVTGLYCFLIFENSSVADPFPIPLTFPFADKVAHIVVFGGLCAVLSLGIRKGGAVAASAQQTIVPIAFTTLYGLSDEVHQLYVPGRTFDWADVAADAAGAIAVQIVLVSHWRRQSGVVHGAASRAENETFDT